MLRMEKAYANVSPEQMILRDHLAHDRTVLANERTLLAYVRTAIAIVASGATLLEFFADIRYLHVLGGVLLGVGVLVLVLGLWRFVVVACQLRRVYRQSGSSGTTQETAGPAA
jgi:putative membrane protein